MFNVRAAARFARLRSVPRQPNPQRKEQHQENSRSFLPFSFSPCSLIKGTRLVSGMLARREMTQREVKESEVLEAEAKEYEIRAFELSKKCSTTKSFEKRAACKDEVRNLRKLARLRRN